MNRAPLSGTLIEGKYEIVAKIKEGGMGTIYRVRHRLLEEIRVVKVMRSQLGNEEEYKSRFVQEARMATRLKHPNVAAIHDFALDRDGTAYIVMEYIDGANLAELLRASGPPSIALTLEIAHQTLSALGYLHRKNVVHRDIALDNLMLTHDEEDRPLIKLIDLGISKALDRTLDLTSRGVFLGKLKYSSPEQLGALASGETLDGRSDLYSLGVALYELLTGHLPLSGESTRAMVGAHLFHPPIPFTVTDPEGRVPEGLRAVVLRALEKKRESRFASAEDFDREILALRERLAGREGVEPTRKLLSRVRATREIPHVPVTPSAQDRLDQKFLAHTTPLPTGSGPLNLPSVEPEAAELEPTVVDGRTQLQSPRKVSARSAPAAKRRIAGPFWIVAASAAAAALAALLLFQSRPSGRSGSPETELPPQTAAAVLPAPALTEAAPAPVPAAPAPEETAAPIPPAAAPPDLSRLRRVAEQFGARAAGAREAAERAGASERATELHSSARRKEREGARLLAAERFESAVEAYQEAADLFRRAGSAALARRPTPESAAQARPSASQPEPSRAAAPSAPLPEPPRIAPATPDAEPTKAAAERPRSTASEDERIRETIRRYLQAQNTLDVDLYARVYPAISGARRQAVEGAWRSLRSQQLEGEILEIRIQDSHAEVRLSERRVAIPRVGSEQRDSRQRTIRLEKRGESWVISSLN